MIDYDKMTVAEHEEYREMQRKAEGFDEYEKMFEKEFPRRSLSHDEGILNKVCRIRHEVLKEIGVIK